MKDSSEYIKNLDGYVFYKIWLGQYTGDSGNHSKAGAHPLACNNVLPPALGLF